jgi:hypothetical protein
VAVGRLHHRNLNSLPADSGDAPGPVAFDHHASFELEAERCEKRDGVVERLHHDADVVHPHAQHS